MSEIGLDLSIVIPLHNGSKTVLNTIKSIHDQTYLPKYELIIQNDSSTDNSVELIKNSEYYKDMNIKIYESNREIHCPGNTRRDGMSHAHGRWITFIDQDDMFVETAFENIFYIINHVNEDKVVISCFTSYNPILEKDTKKFDARATTWLHGKFYNMNYLKKYNINFKENLMSNEDLYFNSKALSIISLQDMPITCIDNITYYWIENSDSESRKNVDDLHYIDRYFESYITAASLPFIELEDEFLDIKDEFKPNLVRTILYVYMYYQSAMYRNINKDKLYENKGYIKKYYTFIKERYNISKEYIIDTLTRGDVYNPCRVNVLSTEEFVEQISFKDFINEIEKEIAEEV